MNRLGGKKQPFAIAFVKSSFAQDGCQRLAPSLTPASTLARIEAICTGATTAPMSVDLSSGGPTRSVSMRAFSLAWNFSAMPS